MVIKGAQAELALSVINGKREAVNTGFVNTVVWYICEGAWKHPKWLSENTWSGSPEDRDQVLLDIKRYIIDDCSSDDTLDNLGYNVGHPFWGEIGGEVDPPDNVIKATYPLAFSMIVARYALANDATEKNDSASNILEYAMRCAEDRVKQYSQAQDYEVKLPVFFDLVREVFPEIVRKLLTYEIQKRHSEVQYIYRNVDDLNESLLSLYDEFVKARGDKNERPSQEQDNSQLYDNVQSNVAGREQDNQQLPSSSQNDVAGGDRGRSLADSMHMETSNHGLQSRNSDRVAGSFVESVMRNATEMVLECLLGWAGTSFDLETCLKEIQETAGESFVREKWDDIMEPARAALIADQAREKPGPVGGDQPMDKVDDLIVDRVLSFGLGDKERFIECALPHIKSRVDSQAGLNEKEREDLLALITKASQAICVQWISNLAKQYPRGGQRQRLSDGVGAERILEQRHGIEDVQTRPHVTSDLQDGDDDDDRVDDRLHAAREGIKKRLAERDFLAQIAERIVGGITEQYKAVIRHRDESGMASLKESARHITDDVIYTALYAEIKEGVVRGRDGSLDSSAMGSAVEDVMADFRLHAEDGYYGDYYGFVKQIVDVVCDSLADAVSKSKTLGNTPEDHKTLIDRIIEILAKIIPPLGKAIQRRLYMPSDIKNMQDAVRSGILSQSYSTGASVNERGNIDRHS